MKIKIGEGEYEYVRPHLKQWLILQDKQVDIEKAIEIKEINEITKHLVSFISIALSIPETTIIERPWYEVASSYLTIRTINLPRLDFPFLKSRIQDKRDTWDYDGRTWYIWVDLFAQRFHWSLDAIADLDVDDAIALAQEIAVDNQLKREWEWMLSWIAHQSKDGFKPLTRPDWMLFSRKPVPVQKVKIRKEFMPVGNIIRYNPSEDQ